MRRKYDDREHGEFITWTTEYAGEFGEPWVAWYTAHEADGWEFRAAKVVKRGKKDHALVEFRRPKVTEPCKP